MESSKPGDDRWKELADLLGLPSEQDAAASVVTQPIAATPEPAPISHVAAQLDREPVHIEPATEETYEEIEEIVESDEVIDEPELPSIAADDESAEGDEEETAEAPALPGEEDKPKRGRRRRRRGRRRNGDKPEGEEARPGQPVAARPPEQRDQRQGQPRPRDDRNARPAQPASSRDRDANGDSRSRRGGGRRDEAPEQRRPEVEEHEELSEELEEVEMSNAPAALAKHLDDDTDFSDWTVPSWQELISSLYRPDR